MMHHVKSLPSSGAPLSPLILRAVCNQNQQYTIGRAVLPPICGPGQRLDGEMNAVCIIAPPYGAAEFAKGDSPEPTSLQADRSLRTTMP